MMSKIGELSRQQWRASTRILISLSPRLRHGPTRKVSSRRDQNAIYPVVSQWASRPVKEFGMKATTIRNPFGR
ncbi:hypothetical protein GCG54_00010506 [Colletotrichum gloeosporioides]|uniref:Uncharacterized protein n=1 Tax=Colletotrichum gloeosporioides TaxID=474922 RepID=A0A8H4C6G3_COLGL|nr:uncharacterized protein GCG54_00010506 [Colletotrichum gloeosporioides]KAF3798160.1 hypothetical protein GCG54_00010506 [Colletotrichum gloeosporioides]